MYTKRGSRKKIASDEDVPTEKWLVAYRKSTPYTTKNPYGSVFVRQFYAPGYYEAYDIVLTHAERMNLEVLWFREKRCCEAFFNKNLPELESICTYCNKKFNFAEPLPCVYDACDAELCSKECMTDHCKLRHQS